MIRLSTTLSMALLAGAVAAQAGRAPGHVTERIIALRAAHRTFTTAPLLRAAAAVPAAAAWRGEVERGAELTLDEASTGAVLAERPDLLALELPSDEGPVVLDLERVDITTDDFSVVAASGAPVAYTAGVHYRGSVRGDDASVAAISVFGDEVMGLITDQAGDRVLGKLPHGGAGAHILYRTSALRGGVPPVCATPDDATPYTSAQLKATGHAKTAKCVRFYWEVNYDIFQGKGSVTNATNYVTGLFNQSATLYANDGITVALSQVYVWDVASPYTSTSTSTLLTQFGDNRTSFNGDLANLLGYAGGGGIAWISGLCNSQARYKMAYSGISSTYQSVPTYSWSVEVVTHEQGHLLGSKHTHACAWNGNNTPIDGCGPAAGYSEGSCTPGPVPTSAVGGTIMSYCHLVSAGIRFANGFGPQPTTVIVNNINNAACLSACSTGCGSPAGLAASAITTSGATLSWTAVSGATSYTLQWKLASASTWTTVSGLTTASYALSGLSAGTAYSFQVLAVCASGSSAYATAVNFTTGTAAACGVPTGLGASAITTSGATLGWTAVSGASSYTLQYKLASASTWTTVTGITTTSRAITGLSAGTAYNAQVRTVCASGSSAYSAAVTFTTTAAGCTDSYEPNNTTGTARTITANSTVNALIGSSTDKDFFKFANTTAAKNIRIDLSGMPGDYDVRLYRGTTLLASSQNGGTTAERIIYNTSTVSTDYRIRVVGYGGAYSTTVCYALSVQISATAFAMPAAAPAEAKPELEEGDAEATAFPVRIFPNPAQQEVSIVVPASDSPTSIELLDEVGRVVGGFTQGAMEAPSTVGWDVSERPNGVYLVRVVQGDAQFVQRLVVAH